VSEQEIRDRFRAYVDNSAALLSVDLAALLNRAVALSVNICPYRHGHESSYSIEWTCDRVARYLDVDWDKSSETWKVTVKETPDE
jgi:hypothetical protein